MIRIIITIVLTIVMSFGVFAQSKNAPTKDAVEQLMSLGDGMKTVNGITESLAKDLTVTNSEKFRAEMNIFKVAMLKTAVETFTKDYTDTEVKAIYKEFNDTTIIDRSDLTNNFFAKWRKIKGTFFKSAKETYFKYK